MDIGRQRNIINPYQAKPEEYSTFRAVPMSGSMGAIIEGADLKKPTEKMVGELRQALTQHLAIFFHGQFLAPKDLVRFGRMFGTLEKHRYWDGLPEEPDVFELYTKGGDAVHYGSNWHSDLTCAEEPPAAAMLSAVSVPSYGGDTMFSNLYLAYDSLSPAFRKMLEPLEALHEANFQVDPKNNFKSDGHSEIKQKNTSRHPLICTHPVSNLKYILANRIFTKSIADFTPEESRGILDYLYLHMSRPEFTCRFHWQNGSVAFWDNRATCHYAVGDFRGIDRRMQRITFQGTKPVR